jgi:hypothetical protein
VVDESAFRNLSGAAAVARAGFALAQDDIAATMTYAWYAQGVAHLQKAGSIADAINGAVTLAGIRIAQGRLRTSRR